MLAGVERGAFAGALAGSLEPVGSTVGRAALLARLPLLKPDRRAGTRRLDRRRVRGRPA
jgi:hypothetical protein